MEEDKKILEEGIQKMIQDERIHDDYRNMLTAISNLISENKELEKENTMLKNTQNNCPYINTSGVKCQIKELEKENKELKEDNAHQWEERCKLTFELEECIPKSKIEDKIKEFEELNNYIRNLDVKHCKSAAHDITRNDYAVNMLKELLEE